MAKPPKSQTPSKADHLETATYAIDPRELKLLDKNARHMNAKQFTQLVANVQRDGVLTSAPLVHRAEDRLVVLSGNHRVKAAVAAGLATVTVIEVKGELTKERLIALQLSHNAITGEDDQNILRELYESLDVLEQRYSGLMDNDFGLLEDLDLTKLSLGQPSYQTINLAFLPEDHEIFVDAMQQITKGAKNNKRYIARLADFEQFEKTLVAVSDTLDIRNQALAVLAMAELAMDQLDHLTRNANGDGQGTGETSGQAASGSEATPDG
jgi:hypothetical protein